jgi:uncharacterized protein (TIRG00374 family)
MVDPTHTRGPEVAPVAAGATALGPPGTGPQERDGPDSGSHQRMTPSALTRAGEAAIRNFQKHLLVWLALVGLAALVVVVDPRQLLTAVDRVHAGTLILMAILAILSLTMRSLAWQAILRGQDVKAKAFKVVRAEFAAQAMILMPAADLARATLLRRSSRSAAHKTPSEIAASIVLDEICFLAALTLAAVPQAIGGVGPSLAVLAILAGFSLLFAMLIYEPAYAVGLRLVSAVRPLRSWTSALRSMRVAFVKLLRARTLARVAFFDLCAVVFAVALLYVALHAVGASTAALPAVAFALAVANLTSGLSLVPIGLGVFEGTITLLLVGAGIAPGEAAAAALLYRGFNDGFMGGLGAIIALGARRRRKPLPAERLSADARPSLGR